MEGPLVPCDERWLAWEGAIRYRHPVMYRCCWVRACGWLGLFVFGLVWSTSFGWGASRLGGLGVTNGVVSIRLEGEAGRSYRLETSGDLKFWEAVETRQSIGQPLIFQDPLHGAARATFYRAVEVTGVAAAYGRVTAQADEGLAMSGLASPDLETPLELRGLDDVSYALILPTNAVVDTVVVRMTVLTNVVGSGGVNGFLAGVRLEPQGLVLSSPAFLEIRFPADRPVPVSLVASYSFENDGSLQHLVPDLVQTNRVRIPVTSLRSYACGVFTGAEFQALEVTVPPVSTASVRLQSTFEECYPQQQAAAERLRKELTDKMRPRQQAVAAALGEARRKALLGVEEPGNAQVMEGVGREMDAFYAEELEPRIKAGPASCGEGKELSVWLLGMERQAQLLGIRGDDSPMSAALNAYLCAALGKCSDEALACCRAHGPDMRVETFVLGMERQAQLLGFEEGSTGCGAEARATALTECLPAWMGKLTITDYYSSETARHSSAYTSFKQVDRSSYALEAHVATATVLDLGLYKQLDVVFVGELVASRTSSMNHQDVVACDCNPAPAGLRLQGVELQDGCPGSLTETSRSAGTLTTNVTLKLSFYLPGDLVIPGLDPSALGLDLRNHSTVQHMVPQAQVHGKGMTSKLNTCPEAGASNGLTLVEGDDLLPVTLSPDTILKEVYGPAGIVFSATRNKALPTQEGGQEWSFRVQLEMHPRTP